MSFDGSGNFVRSDGTRTGTDVCQQQADANVNILPSLFDNELNEITTGLEACVTKNGETGAFTANINAGSNRIINVTTPTAQTDASNALFVQNQTCNYAGAFGGSSGAFTATLTPAPTAYTTGMIIRGKTNHAHNGAATINVNSLGAKSIFFGNMVPSGNSFLGDDVLTLVYDGTAFEVIAQTRGATTWTPTYNTIAGSSGSISSATTTEAVYKYSDLHAGIDFHLTFNVATSASFDRTITITLPVSSSNAVSDRACIYAAYARSGSDTPATALCHAYVGSSTLLYVTIPDQATGTTDFPDSSTLYFTIRGSYRL